MFKARPVVFEDSFALLQDGLLRLYHGNVQSNLSGIELHQLVYDMCSATPTPYAERLFASIARFLELRVDQLYQEIVSNPDILSAYAVAWEHYALVSRSVNFACQYLNRSLLDHRMRNGRPIGELMPQWTCKYRRQSVASLANAVWRDRLAMRIRREQEDRLVRQLILALETDRDGACSMPEKTLRCVIQSFVELGAGTKEPLAIYRNLFEAAWIYRTRTYYEREARNAVAELSLSQFIHRVHARLEEESARCRRFLDPSSRDKVLHPMVVECIVSHSALIYGEFRQMLSQENQKDCATSYSLMMHVKDGIKPLRDTFEAFVVEGCRRVLAGLDWESPKIITEYVEQLAQLHDHYEGLCIRFFNNDPSFIAAFDKAFHALLNDRIKLRQPEALAKHCDQLLRKPSKQTIEALEERLRMLIKLFGYLDDKDVFQKFYTRAMARRLISDASLAEELELTVISLLRHACGVDFVSKLQRMCTDINLNRDLNQAFCKWLVDEDVPATIGHSVLALTTGAWPLTSTATSQLIIPPPLEGSVAQFVRFYQEKFTGRKLTWLWHMSKADVRVNYLDRRYELSVTLYQLALLLCFNEKTRFTLAEICQRTGLLSTDLTRTAKSMVDAKLLNMEGSLDDRPMQAVLSLNTSFTSKRNRIKLSSPLQIEAAQEAAATTRAVEEDRRLFMQAVLVRIMKSRRSLTHGELVSEAITLARTRFMPEVAMIKRTIEQLIDKQFLERDPKKRDVYLYVA
ncbi:Cullin [Thamnocephalis sphaerospora]|uniref:Cullin-5 n=1 Tax=Thamnocephalis sphaerospora TaxID=78915 RepID=A0A4P9XTM3_9FUNG|nr:Cullin [Thamnocephalis sphaerospora]|eukprot:RKP08790.1 Cullin [Thamnocephalis sphaerospora]